MQRAITHSHRLRELFDESETRRSNVLRMLDTMVDADVELSILMPGDAGGYKEGPFSELFGGSPLPAPFTMPTIRWAMLGRVGRACRRTLGAGAEGRRQDAGFEAHS